MKTKFSILISYLLFNSCTTIQKQSSDQNVIMLPKGTKLIDIAWKGRPGQLWYLTRPMTDSDTATTYKFTGEPSFDTETTYTIIETK